MKKKRTRHTRRAVRPARSQNIKPSGMVSAAWWNKHRTGGAVRASGRLKKPAGPGVPVTLMGTPIAIEYTHAATGEAMRHKFTGRAVRLYRTKSGTHLIIGPVKASKYIRG